MIIIDLSFNYILFALFVEQGRFIFPRLKF
jgi:hypothetical protein